MTYIPALALCAMLAVIIIRPRGVSNMNVEIKDDGLAVAYCIAANLVVPLARTDPSPC